MPNHRDGYDHKNQGRKRQPSPLFSESQQRKSQNPQAIRKAEMDDGTPVRRIFEIAPHWIIAIATIGLGYFAYMAWDESTKGTAALKGQLSELQEQRRAWVSIASLQFDRSHSGNGQNVPLLLRYGNVGKTPALDFAIRARGFTANPPPSGQGWNELKVRPNEECRLVDPVRGAGAVYPSAPDAYAVFITKPTPLIFEPLKDLTEAWYLEGCIAYTTLGKTKHSGFCFFLYPEPDKPSDQWGFLSCGGANSAD